MKRGTLHKIGSLTIQAMNGAVLIQNTVRSVAATTYTGAFEGLAYVLGRPPSVARKQAVERSVAEMRVQAAEMREEELRAKQQHDRIVKRDGKEFRRVEVDFDCVSDDGKMRCAGHFNDRLCDVLPHCVGDFLNNKRSCIFVEVCDPVRDEEVLKVEPEVGIVCETREEAKQVLSQAHELGGRWAYGNSFLDKDYFVDGLTVSYYLVKGIYKYSTSEGSKTITAKEWLSRHEEVA